MIDSINQQVIEIENTLKDFQAATVNYVINQFFEKDRKKILVADEVGLGKTIIAKGVLLKALQRNYVPNKPYNVIYICSNQVLAHQNIKKLNPFKENANPVNRLIFLAFEPIPSSQPLSLSTLTPSTSFQITNSVGVKEERAIIFQLLFNFTFFKNRESVLRGLFKGNNQISEANWNYLLDTYKPKLRLGLSAKFKSHLQHIKFSFNRFPLTYSYLNTSSDLNLWEAIRRLCDKLHQNEDNNSLRFSYEIVRALRYELTQVCVSFLDADLFILDEFQRFKTLLDGDDESEASEIAKAVLRDSDTRVLLLSATPFKPFTTKLEEMKGEAHFDEFRKLIVYLGGENGNKLWEDIRRDQEAFFELLRFPKTAIENIDAAVTTKNSLQKRLKNLISRNERMSVSLEHDNMISMNTFNKMTVIKDDINNFIAVDQITETLKELSLRKSKMFGSTIEFSKSTPYPLSYLRGYKLHESLQEFKENNTLKNVIKKHKESFIDFNKIKQYKPVGLSNDNPTYPNGKLRMLAEECFEDNGHLLLWVPPSKPYYKQFGSFKNSTNFSKILVFSGWVMVPRAISTLISYEAERRTIGKEDFSKNQEQHKRSYFSKEGKRHPRPLITFPSKEDSLHMTNVCLTYPSWTLNKWILERNPFDEQDVEYSNVKLKAAEKIRYELEKLNIEDKFSKDTKHDVRWYWILPALLDHLNNNDTLVALLVKTESGGKLKHYQTLNDTICKALEGTLDDLGLFPMDIYDVLADITLASPASTALRALTKIFDDSLETSLSHGAYNIAEGFISLFNKPESIAVVRLSVDDQFYWKQILEYSASGNIQSLLDEYIYLLKECEGKNTIEEISDGIAMVLKIKSTSIKVDDKNTFFTGESKEMRCHFAISYGDQKISTESGSDRMVNVREVFNSPFRPFVLTSTSVGQEGLDFHYYCRKIFHWNLPHNPVDLEQREGRINRYKAFVIRKNLAEMTKHSTLNNQKKNIWAEIFKNAVNDIKKPGDSDLIPFWYLNEANIKIERFVPIHELSKDQSKFNSLKESLALYRLTFGQPRQEELLDAMKNSGLSSEEINILRSSLMLNLSQLETKI
ncbi:DEAD/DEAH box helicase family protein [Pedobacter sp. Leaf250]|uniref:DEAD/DEAH box helicase family protein n=1 Tax=Pedobacter sp. Leaf250 TaxID=2876559 RepID=UPI001E6394ED|nr:DEAD/DEAH box helicase family protein [Pedobacter sp. Leaf250]